MMRLQQQFLTFLTLATVTGIGAAFVPPNKLRASLKALRSTSPSTSRTTDTSSTAAADDLLNQDKFLADMNRELSSKAKSPPPPPPPSPDMIPADPTYVTEARLRIAALADEAEELKQQYELEIQDLRAKSVWESFKTRKQIREEERKAMKVQAASKEVETAEATSSSSSDSDSDVPAGWIGVALIVAVASFVAVEPVSMANNLNLDNLNMPNMDLDLTSIQEQAQSSVGMMLVWSKEMQTMILSQVAETQVASTAKFQELQSDMVAGASNWKDAAMTMTNNVQETLAQAGADWEGTVPSMLTSAGDDLKRVLLRQ